MYATPLSPETPPRARDVSVHSSSFSQEGVVTDWIDSHRSGRVQLSMAHWHKPNYRLSQAQRGKFKFLPLQPHLVLRLLALNHRHKRPGVFMHFQRPSQISERIVMRARTHLRLLQSQRGAVKRHPGTRETP